MFTETFGQDLRVGFRVLRKERAFSLLAVVVLALGICGVATMFSVVNGVMLRGFSFPNADRLASANFVDPSSANFFGVNGQISAMDFEEIRPVQQSFERLAAYLNGSTVNVTVDGSPLRVIQQGVVQIAIGLVLGLGLALALAVAAADGIQNVLFGVTGRDPLIYVAVGALVALVSLVATVVPARRATRVDPMIALRAE